MVQVTGTDSGNVLHYELANGESVTVPTGEVWVLWVNMTYTEEPAVTDSNKVLDLNGGDLCGIRNRDAEVSERKIVVTGGDTLSCDGGGSDDTIFLTGFDVTNTVDNTPVQAHLTNGDSISVPSGETWVVWSIVSYTSDPIATTHNKVLDLNGSACHGIASDVQEVNHKKFIVTGGDQFTADIDGGHVYISGFKI